MPAMPGKPESIVSQSSRQPRGVVVLGCTGSIGETTFTVLEGLEKQAGPDLRVIGLSAGRRVDRLIEQARRWQVQVVCVADASDRVRVQEALPGCVVLSGV